jgi:Mrp family chromosome partitioning ATPase
MKNQSNVDTANLPTMPRVVIKSPMVAPEPATPPPPLPKRDAAVARLFQEQCRQLNVSTFFQENSLVRSLGFTSAINGEGKSFLSMVTANLLANDSSVPVTLVECNWEHPNIHTYYDIPASPGAAEWIRKECNVEDIRHRVGRNLTVIPAGKGRTDAVKLLAQVRQQGLLQLFAPRNDLLVVDLPSIATTAYGPIAASLLDAVVIVVHAGVTPDTLVEAACSTLKNVPVQGIILNQLQSKIPRWLRQIL